MSIAGDVYGVFTSSHFEKSPTLWAKRPDKAKFRIHLNSGTFMQIHLYLSKTLNAAHKASMSQSTKRNNNKSLNTEKAEKAPRRSEFIPLLTTGELSEILGVTPHTIHTWRYEGTSCPPAIIIGNKLRFRVTDVEKWINSQAENLGGAA